MPILFDVNFWARPEVSSIIALWRSFIKWVDPFLAHLDPSHFQNVIIGILAIYIPVAIIFLNKFVSLEKMNKRTEFEKLVLTDEVLVVTQVFWFAILGIAFFAFLDGTCTSLLLKVISIFAVALVTYLLWKPFKNLLRFAGGYSQEFEIRFLKKLSFTKTLFSNNKKTADKMRRSWKSIWSEENIVEEREFTEIFISHLNKAETSNQNGTIVSLLSSYRKNLANRRVLYQLKDVYAFALSKYNVLHSTICDDNTKDSMLPSTNEQLLRSIFEQLLRTQNGSHVLFRELKRTIDIYLKKYDDSSDTTIKRNYSRIVPDLIEMLSTVFFDKINESPDRDAFRKYIFPDQWRITSNCTDNRISKMINGHFIAWGQDKIIKKPNQLTSSQNVNDIVRIFFPNVDYLMLQAFFLLYFSGDNNVETTLDKECNFSGFTPRAVTTNQDERKKYGGFQKAVDIKRADLEKKQKQETIQVILTYFQEWQTLSFSNLDCTPAENENWESYKKEKKLAIKKRVQNQKLTKIKLECESDAMNKFCKGSDLREMNRRAIIELLDLLIAEINSPTDKSVETQSD